jgi:hypothetical protein
MKKIKLEISSKKFNKIKKLKKKIPKMKNNNMKKK